MSSPSSSTDPNDPRDGAAYLPPGAARRQDQGGGDGAHPVDQIAIRKRNGYNFITPAQWIATDRQTRAELIRSDQVLFLHQGEQVAVRAALLWLRADGGADG